ncbi:MAG: sulfatase [Bryobacterales bacterium]|nr:sulfatase [Bryobacterales bacterium]
MTRRDLLLASSALSASGPAAEAQTRRRPNILILIADDLNDYSLLKSFPGVKTPHLDKFQSQSVTFTRAYCAAPACIPSRAATFSGLYPHTTGAYLNGCDPWNKAPIQSAEPFPALFRRAGYATFGAGKLTHAPVPKALERAMWDNEPYGGGFGPFVSDEERGPEHKDRFWYPKPWTEPDTDFPDVRNASSAIEFLNQPRDKPFLLTLGLWRPHTPFTAPKRFFDLYDPARLEIPVPGYRDGDMDDIPALGRKLSLLWGERFVGAGRGTEAEWRRFLHAYFACTSFADWSAGRVLDALDASPHARDTWVFFFSDNGYHCGEKNHWEKTTLWEKSALTPILVRQPGGARAGARCARTVTQVDLYPTLREICDLPAPKHTIQGRSLVPLLRNPADPWAHPALTTYGEGYASIRDERYRYIRYPDATEELYDHAADPNEWNNLAAKPESAPIKQRLGALMPEKFAPTMGGRLG